MVTEELKRLYYGYTGSQAEDITELPSSGSNRRYFRISGPKTLIGVSGSSLEENKAFIYMAGFFKGKEKKEAQNKIDQCKERIRKQKDELHILVKKSGYPNVQKFMDGYRTAYKIVEQYKKELEIWKQKTGQNDIQPERKKSVLERLKENEKRVKERERLKSVNKQKRHDWLER